jgi:hypothetical protein
MLQISQRSNVPGQDLVFVAFHGILNTATTFGKARKMHDRKTWAGYSHITGARYLRNIPKGISMRYQLYKIIILYLFSFYLERKNNSEKYLKK